MHNPFKYAILFFLCCLGSCTQKETPEATPFSTHVKKGPSTIISGDSVLPPKRIRMEGMKGIPLNNPEVRKFKIPYDSLNRALALKGNLSSRRVAGKLLQTKPLELIKKSKSLKPERIKVDRPSPICIPEKLLKRYSSSERFKNGGTNGLTKDVFGQLWVANGKYGITQYDGTFAYYYSIEEGAPEDGYYDLKFDQNNTLWLTSSEGLVYFDGSHFSSFKFPVSPQIGHSRDGYFWLISKEQLFRFDPNQKTFNEVEIEGIGDIHHFYQGSEYLWISTNEGICKMPFTLNNSFQAEFFAFPKDFPKTHITSICKTRSGDIWLGSRDGLFQWQNIKNQKEIYWFKEASGAPSNYAKNNPTILGIKETVNEELNILVRDGGLVLLDHNKPSLTYKRYGPEVGIPINSRRLYQLEGEVWIGCQDGAISIHNNPYKFWEVNLEKVLPKVNCGAFDKWGRLWIGYYGAGIALVEVDEEQKVITTSHFTRDQLKDAYIDNLQADDKGNLWLGTRVRGLSRIKLDSTSVSGTLYNYHEEYGFPADVVPHLTKAKDGSIWAAIYDHGDDPKAGFAKLDEEGILFFGKDQGLLTDDVWSIGVDSKNQVWPFNVDGHASCYKINSEDQINTIHRFERDQIFMDNFIRSGAIDKHDNAWVGFEFGKAITCISPDQDSFILRRFTEKDGLLDTKVNSMFNDSNGNLWIGTSRGLLRVDSVNVKEDQFSFKFFDIYNGLPSTGFHLNGIFENDKNEIWVVGSNRLYWFDPNDITLQNTQPPTLIKSISLFNEAVIWESEKEIRLDNGVEVKAFKFDSIRNWNLIPENLSLKYDNNFLSIECASIDISQTDQLEYSYRVSEKEGWSKPTEDPKIVLGKLNPGSYNFQVKSRTSSGDWGQINQYSFSIRPPWWKTWLAYLGYFLLGIALMYLIIQIRLSIATDKVKSLEKIRSKISADLHDDVGSLLTGISMQSEFLALECNDGLKGELNILGDRSREAMDKMRDIVWAMDATKDKFENLIDRMRHNMELTFKRTDFKCSFETQNIEGSNFISPDKRQNIYLIFKEALTNIVKYSNGNLVKVSLSKFDKELILTIHDNGNDIKLNEAGQGIQNMKNRAKAINGEVSIETKNGFKVEFSVEV